MEHIGITYSNINIKTTPPKTCWSWAQF